MNREPFAPCPICNGVDISYLIHCKDYSLTKQNFDIIQCASCSLKYTFPIPSTAEIPHFYDFPAYISHSDVKTGWMNQMYHYVRNRTLKQKTKWVQSLFTGHKGALLEVGAGTGAFANAMYEKGWAVTGLEPDENSRTIALEKYKLTLLPIESLNNIAPKSKEVITLWHVLEHVHDLKGYLTSFKSILKPNGRLIIAVPNYTSYDAQYYKKYWAAYDVPRHLYHFSPSSMKILLNQFNMQIVETKPMWFDSFYVSILSEQFRKSGSLGILRAFIIGCISNLKAMKDPTKASSIVYVIKENTL